MSTSKWTRSEILKTTKDQGIHFLRLQFTDILGTNKNVEVPANQFEKALDGEIAFDGSSIEGFVRIEESDMFLIPDLDTFGIFPFETGTEGVARLICDVHNPDGSKFTGCPRLALKKVIAEAEKLGFTMMAGPEAEFFLFERDEKGAPTTLSTDTGGYFDLTPIDYGEDARRDIVIALEAMGFEVEAAHHEVAPAQHEIDFKYADALTTADNIATFRFIVRQVALQHGLHATFMPKPLTGVNGSGMHVHQSLFAAGENAFHDPQAKYELSKVAIRYIGGILAHARGFCAITNPLVNSYKRLVPGYEAPTNIAWSLRNRSPLVRVPEKRGVSTRIEVRMPDPSANPYLALAVMLKAGLDGIINHVDPGPPIDKNIFAMSETEQQRLKIHRLPHDLMAALNSFELDDVIRGALTPHIVQRFLAAKAAEWAEYAKQVHEWEVERYLGVY